MGNTVERLANSEVSNEAIKETFGIDVTTLKPGCVMVLLDVDGPVAYQVSPEEIPEIKRGEFETMAMIAMAFADRVANADDSFCQELADWAVENMGDEVGPEDSDASDDVKDADGEDGEDEEQVPPRRLLH